MFIQIWVLTARIFGQRTRVLSVRRKYVAQNLSEWESCIVIGAGGFYMARLQKRHFELNAVPCFARQAYASSLRMRTPGLWVHLPTATLVQALP
jgi:hypothetical protein